MKPDARLDVTSEVCPISYVKTKLQLEEMEPGQVLETIIRGPKSLRNITRSCPDDGFEILSREEIAPGIWRCLIRA